jgi:hypothetical protein
MQNQILGNSQNMLGQVSNRVNSVLDNTESGLGNLLNNTYVSVSLKVFLALYAAFVAPEVSKNFAIFMDSTIVRVIFAALIVYSAIHDPMTAILLAIVFVITLQTAAKHKIYSTSESVLVPGGISWLPSAKQGAVMGTNYDIGNRFLSGVENVAGGVVGGVQELGGGVVGTVRNLGQGVVGGVQELGGGVVGGVRQVGTGLMGGVQELGGGVAGGVRQVGTGLIGGVQELGGGVVGGMSRLGGCLVDSAQDIGTGLVGGVQKVGSGLVGGVQQLGSSVVDSSQYVGSGLMGGVQDLGTGVVGGIRQLGSGFMGGVRQVGSSVSSGVKTVISPIEHMENPVVAANGSVNTFTPFTSDEQFNDAESNFVPGSNQDNCVQTFANQYCAQGMQTNWVQGF